MSRKVFGFDGEVPNTVSEPTTCLAFRYREVPYEDRLRKVTQIGAELLNQIARHLKAQGLEFGEPSLPTKKAFFSGMECRLADDILLLVAIYLDEEDKWALMTGLPQPE